MRLRVKVKQEHIDRGWRGDSRSCAIARAFRPTFAGISVGQSIILGNEEKPWRSTPQIEEFISRFDNGMPVRPFEFDMPIPDQYIECVRRSKNENLQLIEDENEAKDNVTNS